MFFSRSGNVETLFVKIKQQLINNKAGPGRRTIQTSKMIKNLTESLLPQPPSFGKKKSYDVQQLLGRGTFGKVMVCFDQEAPNLILQV